MERRPQLNFWQIWNMSFGFLGIQFGWALQLSNVSRIFQTMGASIDDIAILWIAAPVTGLIVQPIVGHFSDRTWTRMGRRRPFFLAGAILASVSLVIMPNASALWMAAGLLWILDASINISMEPFRAFVGDMLPAEQRTRGFAMQSFFIGVGSVVASVFPYALTKWVGISNTAAPGVIPPSVVISFYVGAAVFVGAVLWTVLRTREYPPEEMERFNDPVAPVEDLPPGDMRRLSWRWLAGGLAGTAVVFWLALSPELYILTGGLVAFGVLLLLADRSRKDGGLTTMITDLLQMPPTMKKLAWVQFFSWFGLFSMFLYATAAITSHVYGTSDTTSQLFNDGADWVGVLFAVYNGVAALVAFSLPIAARKLSMRTVHAIALWIGGLGLASIYLVSEPNWLVLPMIGVGVAWASILSMPYAILTGVLPQRKLGVYMGIFNFFIVIPQITASTGYGFLLQRLFDEHAIYVLVSGGISLIIAGLLMFRIGPEEGA